MPYAVIYGRKPNTVFTEPEVAASESNYGEIIAGNNRSLWECKRTFIETTYAWVPINIAAPVQPSWAADQYDVGQEVEAADGSIWTGYVVSSSTVQKWVYTGSTEMFPSDPCETSAGSTCSLLGATRTSCQDFGEGYLLLECQEVTVYTYGWQFVRDRVLCSECPPTTAGTVDDQCYCSSLDQVYEYQVSGNEYDYYWEKVEDGHPDIIMADIVKYVEYKNTRRAYDDDESTIKGYLENDINEPVLFVLKSDKNKTLYAAYIKNWKYDENTQLVSFKGVDFKRTLNSEVQLEFFLDDPSDNLSWTVVLGAIFNQFNDAFPVVKFTYANIPVGFNPDTTIIANLWGQRQTIEARSFVKIYLSYYGAYLNTWFDESTLEVNICVTMNDNTSQLMLKDFIFEKTVQEVSINQAIATIEEPEDSESSPEAIDWFPVTVDYYDVQDALDNIQNGDGFVPDLTNMINPIGSTPDTTNSEIYRIDLTSTFRTDFLANQDELLYIPKHKNIDFNKSFIYIIGTYRLFFQNGSYTDYTIPVAASLDRRKIPEPYGSLYQDERYLIVEHKSNFEFNEFGQGWFQIKTGTFAVLQAVTNAYLYIYTKGVTSSNMPANFLNDLQNSVYAIKNEEAKDLPLFEFGKDVDEHLWYMRPIDQVLYEGDVPPYGLAYKATNTEDPSVTKYWQLGQKPVTPLNLPKIEYYLGLDNQIYQGHVPGNKFIFPVVRKYFTSKYLTTAQLKAVSALVDARENDNVIINDNDILNPMEIAILGLYAKIDVYDKYGVMKTIPISEITTSNKETKVKLGFKKLLLTEVIKSKLGG